jgi:hypothetical protein
VKLLMADDEHLPDPPGSMTLLPSASIRIDAAHIANPLVRILTITFVDALNT